MAPPKQNNQEIEYEIRLQNAIISSKVGAMRMHFNLSIPELAERSGISIDTITTIESGLTTPDLETLTRLARSMGRHLFIEFVER